MKLKLPTPPIVHVKPVTREDVLSAEEALAVLSKVALNAKTRACTRLRALETILAYQLAAAQGVDDEVQDGRKQAQALREELLGGKNDG